LSEHIVEILNMNEVSENGESQLISNIDGIGLEPGLLEVQVDTISQPTEFSQEIPNTFKNRFIEQTDKPCKSLLLESEFTDVHSQMIKDISFELTAGLTCDKEKVKVIFNWTKNKIKYQVGLNKDNASRTIVKGFGSCLNKANVLVSLLRSSGFNSGFSVMRVKTKEYFGPLGFKRFYHLVSDESNHVYAQVFLNGKWIKLDATDDLELSLSTMHLEQQGEPVVFDGVNHACLNLDKDHIVKDNGDIKQNLDFVFNKRQKVPTFVINIFNICMSYVRLNGKYCKNVDEIEKLCFNYLKQNHPSEFAMLQMMENEKLNQVVNRVYSVSRLFKLKGLKL